MAYQAGERSVREEGIRGLSCEGCIHSVVKARLVEFRFCNKYKVPRMDRCIDFLEKGNASKREG